MSAITSKSFEILNHFILPLQMLEVQTTIISSNRYNIHRPQIQPYAGMLSFHFLPFKGLAPNWPVTTQAGILMLDASPFNFHGLADRKGLCPACA